MAKKYNWLEELFGGTRMGSNMRRNEAVAESQGRTEQAHDAKMAQMAELLKTQQGQTLLTNAKAVNEQKKQEPGKRLGGMAQTIMRFENAGLFDDDANDDFRNSLIDYTKKILPPSTTEKGPDPDVNPKDVLSGNLKGKPQTKERSGERTWNPLTWFGDDTITDEAAGGAAKKSVNDLVRAGFSQEDAVSRVQDEYNARQSSEGDRKYLPEGKLDVRSLFSDGPNPFQEGGGKTTKTTPAATTQNVVPAKPLEDYFQAPTDTVPEDNTPKTFEQVGITDPNEQAAIQEMQEAAPDVDVMQEYQDDPESMKRLLKLWEEGKLNKQNLFKAFSMLQGRAKQTLGIS